MQRLRSVSITVALLVLAACGDSKPSSPAPAGQSGDPITGRERFGWTQSAGSADELQIYRYALYVDGQRTVIEGEMCRRDSNGTSADCSASLPTLSAGRHTLEVAAFFVWDDEIVEGPRSPALQVTVAGVLAGGSPAMVTGGAIVSSDGLRMRADVVARDLYDPVDVAAVGGRVLVADRGGELRIVDAAGKAPEVRDNLLQAVSATPEPGTTELRSIAAASDFDVSGTVHAAYITADRGGPVLRLARLRVRGETAGEAANIGSFPLSDSQSPVVLRAGPDGLLYLAIGSGADDRGAQSLAAPAGKILRLRGDGSPPDDNPRSSLIYSFGHREPRGLAWLADHRSMWEAERGGGEDEINRITGGANYGWPVASGQDAYAGQTEPALALAAELEVAGLTTIADAGSPLAGDLIVSTAAGEDLLRLRFDSEGRLRIHGRLLQRRFGRIGQIAAAGHALYFVTANQSERGPGHEVLVRLTPQAAREPRTR